MRREEEEEEEEDMCYGITPAAAFADESDHHALPNVEQGHVAGVFTAPSCFTAGCSLELKLDRRISPDGGGYPKPAFTEFSLAE